MGENAADWTSVRIRRSTLERLQRIRETLLRAAENGQYNAVQRMHKDVPLDDVINELARRDEEKRERAKKSARTRKRAKLHAADDTTVAD